MAAKVKNGEQVINPPSWYYTYSLTTKPQSNDRGDWYGWDIKRSDPVSADVYAEGKAFHASVKKGGVEVNYVLLPMKPGALRDTTAAFFIFLLTVITLANVS